MIKTYKHIIEKYYYNFKWLFSILIYFNMQLIPVMAKLYLLKPLPMCLSVFHCALHFRSHIKLKEFQYFFFNYDTWVLLRSLTFHLI